MDTISSALAASRHTPASLPLRKVSLDDKYTARDGRIYLSGIQALVRLPIIQKWRDEAAGLNTAGFISGYRGSPLGGMDEALWKAEKPLQANNVRFQPGINEDLAATAVWGTQQVGIVVVEAAPGLGQPDLARGPLQQAETQRGLKLLDAPAQRRLVQVQAFGGAAKAQFLGQGDEGMNILDAGMIAHENTLRD